MQFVYEMVIHDNTGRYVGLIHFKDRAAAMTHPKKPGYIYTDRGFVTPSPQVLQEVNEVGFCEMTLLI